MEHFRIESRSHIFEEYDTCPFCHQGMKPVLRDVAEGKDGRPYALSLIVIWRCPLKDCKKDVVTIYTYTVVNGSSAHYQLAEFLNGSPALPVWPEFITKLENGNPEDPLVHEPSKFAEIYRQALTAEFDGLTEIAGMGYRRAFEFLVKDLAISDHPTEKAEIMKLLLAPVIKQYFPADYWPMMERAAWLGNDETHYERKHPDYDIQDLKRIIAFVITDIDRTKQRDAIIKGMPPKK